jgi:hypothetical protein
VSNQDNFVHSVQSTTLGDLLERILDKGVVISGDIKIKLVEVELLTIQIRLVICSVDRAKEIGLDWWRSDPHLRGLEADGLQGPGLQGPGKQGGGLKGADLRGGGPAGRLQEFEQRLARLEAGALEAGALEAGALEAGALEAGALEAGALEGATIPGVTIPSGAMAEAVEAAHG